MLSTQLTTPAASLFKHFARAILRKSTEFTKNTEAVENYILFIKTLKTRETDSQRERERERVCVCVCVRTPHCTQKREICFCCCCCCCLLLLLSLLLPVNCVATLQASATGLPYSRDSGMDGGVDGVEGRVVQGM